MRELIALRTAPLLLGVQRYVAFCYSPNFLSEFSKFFSQFDSANQVAVFEELPPFFKSGLQR
jgi:hypothetical protein